MADGRAQGVVFDLVCAEGIRVNVKLMAARGDLAHRVYTYQDNLDHEGSPFMLQLRDEIRGHRARVRDHGIELSRHVGHCSAGCRRLTAFNGDTSAAYARAPHRSKPEVPPASELAERVRNGATLEQLGAEYERHRNTIQQRLTTAGYSAVTGEPRRSAPSSPAPKRLGVLPDEPWRADAICAQTDPESFFPEKGGSTREAKSVCSGCTVAAECLDYAIANDERFGIWGGLSERERRAISKAIRTNNLETKEAS
jgi:WhiB family redox-sensing transcriptional regulator